MRVSDTGTNARNPTLENSVTQNEALHTPSHRKKGQSVYAHIDLDIARFAPKGADVHSGFLHDCLLGSYTLRPQLQRGPLLFRSLICHNGGTAADTD